MSLKKLDEMLKKLDVAEKNMKSTKHKGGSSVGLGHDAKMPLSMAGGAMNCKCDKQRCKHCGGYLTGGALLGGQIEDFSGGAIQDFSGGVLLGGRKTGGRRTGGQRVTGGMIEDFSGGVLLGGVKKMAKKVPKQLNAWQAYLKEFKKQNPEMTYKEAMTEAAKSYKKM